MHKKQPSSTSSEIRKLLKLDYLPDVNQVEVITHPISQPLLVVAGAGSGKTETMANRIAYMVATFGQTNSSRSGSRTSSELLNDQLTQVVEAGDILGLTFTRKAVVELRQRVQKRIDAVCQLGGQLSSSNNTSQLPSIFRTKYPQISTYNAFAGQIVQEWGMYSGVNTDARVITDADRFILCRQALLEHFSGEFLDKMNQTKQDEISIDRLTIEALHLIDQINNNLLTFNQVAEFNQKIIDNYTPDNWTITNRRSKDYTSACQKYGNLTNPRIEKHVVLLNAEIRSNLIKICQRFQELKTDIGVVDFSDQVALAYKIVTENPQVKQTYQNRYKYVILDEYQDTSTSQVQLLKAVFGTLHPIVAVGDPNQSIYEWRGASASGILRFNQDFTLPNGEPSHRIELLISRRNDKAILEVANCVAEKLVDNDNQRLVPKLLVRPDGGKGDVVVKMCGRETRLVANNDFSEESPKVTDSDSQNNSNRQFVTYTTEQELILNEKLPVETETVVQYLQEHFVKYNQRIADEIDALTGSDTSTSDVDKQVVTKQLNQLRKMKRRAAVLCSVRADFIKYYDALTKSGILVEVVGLGGLLGLPEIQDILCYLHIVDNPLRSDMMIRLLTSPRVNIDRQGLDILSKYIIVPTKNSVTNTELDNTKQQSEQLLAEQPSTIQSLSTNRRTLIEVVKQLSNSDAQDLTKLHKQLEKNSSGQYQALVKLSKLLNLLEQQLFLPLDQFVAKVINLSGIRSEIYISNNLQKADGVCNYEAKSRTIDAFYNKVVDYTRNAISADLNKFLQYLHIVSQQENEYEQPTIPLDVNAVQLITIHSAKGLEWDVVCAVSQNIRQFLYSSAAVYTKSTVTKSRGEELNGLLAVYPKYQPQPVQMWVSEASVLPSNLRLDVDNLQPLFMPENIHDLPDYDYYMYQYKQAEALRSFNERRRLTYVALTRAKSHLLVTSSLFCREVGAATLPTPFFAEMLQSVNPESYDDHLLVLHTLFKPFRTTIENTNPVQNKPTKLGKWTDYPIQYSKNWFWRATHSLANQLVSTQPLEIEHLPPKVQLLLNERQLNKLKRENFGQYAKIPQHLSTSALVKLQNNRSEFIKHTLRPMPEKPTLANDVGTRFHKWVQQFYTSDDFARNLAGEYNYIGDAHSAPLSINSLVYSFLGSPFAKLAPTVVEKEIYYLQGQHSVVARIDAIFEQDAVSQILSAYNVDGHCSTLIIDWKTGYPPVSEHDCQVKGTQLAAYARAYQRASGVDPSLIGAAFVYITSGKPIHNKSTSVWYFSPTELSEIYSQIEL